ncbi:MAG: metallophosphoesterase [Acidobacteria bacterium]|nr:metallophosphoesterase [Acidobacteriota bacterium]
MRPHVRTPPFVNGLAWCALFLLFACPRASVCAGELPPPNLKVAFIGDQSLGPDAVAVLNLIKLEGAQAVLHSGDLDYADNPAAWEAQVNSVLGPDFPYFVTIGNHDELKWAAAGGYQQLVEARFTRLGIAWSGRLGVRSSFHYRGLFFVLAAPGIGGGFDDGASDLYVREQLAADNSVWSICSWHKNQRLMQVGGKTDETGWGVYEEARKGGAIIATAHEHSYSRTHLLSSMSPQTIASSSNTLSLTKGKSFAFVSGLGGHSVRPQLVGGSWWASAYASTCLAGEAYCQPNAAPGALFGVFNVDGRPNKALFYFKDINGKVVDSFVVYSDVESPPVEPTPVRLLTDEVTGRAVALTSVSWLSEPFGVTTPYDLGTDTRTRVMLFAADVDPTAVGNPALFTAQAEDSQGITYSLPVEFVGVVPGQGWLTQVTVILPAELANAGEVRVQITVRGASSNKVLLSINPSPNGSP